MLANKSKDTSPELELRKALRDSGLTGYRIHNKKLPGKPDACFIGKKVAVFVNGCFWHRCPYCKPSMPKSNVDFWESKFKRNKERDKENRMDLLSMGFRVFTIWECQIKRKDYSIIRDVREALQVNNTNGMDRGGCSIYTIRGDVHKTCGEDQAQEENHS